MTEPEGRGVLLLFFIQQLILQNTIHFVRNTVYNMHSNIKLSILDIRRMYMPSYFFIITVILIAAASSIITILLALFTKSKLLMFIPSIISGIAALGFFIKASFFAVGFEDIGYMILALIAGAIFVISILTSIIIGFVRSNK